MVEKAPQEPSTAPQVAATGLHHARLTMMVINEAHVDNMMIKYRQYLYLRWTAIRSRAVEILHLTGMMATKYENSAIHVH